MSDWWNRLSLAELDPEQWEALCDGCAKCCLHKLEDEDSGEIFYTRVRCRYLQEESCRCSDYPRRSVMVPECIRLEPGMVADLERLPATFAYRQRARVEPLPDCHYLVSGSRTTVHEVGVSIRGREISADYLHPYGYDEHIVTWVE